MEQPEIMKSNPWDFPEDTVEEIDKEPGVINNSIIAEAYEEGTGCTLQGTQDFVKIRELRLEFYDILRIDHLNVCHQLTNLSLSNNVIKEITNLHKLVNLVKLNLSFNKISKIKNLECLEKLEELSLFNNQIAVVENLEFQRKTLRLLSLGHNLINSSSCLAYLRGFKKLASVNFEGNAFVSQFRGKTAGIVGAILPQVAYYNYMMINPKQREEGQRTLRSQLNHLVEVESKAELLNKMQEFKAKVSFYMEKAFVFGFNNHEFYEKIMSRDPEGQRLNNLSDQISFVFDRLKHGLKFSSQKLVKLGIMFYDQRKSEVKKFKNDYEENMKDTAHESTVVIRDFIMAKTTLLSKIAEIYEEGEVDDSTVEARLRQVVVCDKDFTMTKRKAWWDLMEQEMLRHHKNEDNLVYFENKLLESERAFMESVQVEFYNMRRLEDEFFVSLADQVNRRLVADYLNEEPQWEIQGEDQKVLLNKDKRAQLMSKSYKSHLMELEGEEEKILSHMKEWRMSLIKTFCLAEIERNRKAIVSISSFIIHHKKDYAFLSQKALSYAYSFMEVADPQWTHEINRIKMDSKERAMDDRMEASRRERFQSMAMCKRMELEVREANNDKVDEEIKLEELQREEIEMRAKRKAYRLAYSTLIQRDTQLESIYEKWESVDEEACPPNVTGNSADG